MRQQSLHLSFVFSYMSWVENYRLKHERERIWTVSADGSTVYRGDGCRFKRTVLPSIAERSASSDDDVLEDLEESEGFSEIPTKVDNCDA